MKKINYFISINEKKTKAFEWGKIIAITGSTQFLIQVISFASGVLIIRLLPTQEYALYTLTNTMLGTMTILADGGIAAGVMAKGGGVWLEKIELGKVLSSGMDLRKKFALISFLVAIPILIFLLKHHDASWLMIVLICLSLAPAFFSSLSNTILQIPVKLRQDLIPLQTNQVEANFLRLGMLMLTLFIFPWCFIAILAAGLPQIWANYTLKKISIPYADWNQKPSPIIKKDILKFVHRILPGAIYYCLSGQISIWIISLNGSTLAVASLGALGRLSMILGLFGTLFGILVVPRFARLSKNTGLLKKYFQIQTILLLLMSTIIFLIWLIPSYFLWILGKDYENLEFELVISIAGSCVSLLAGLSFTLFTSRGFAINPLYSIPINILSIVAGAIFLNVSTLEGILFFNLFISGIQYIMNGIYGGLKMR